MSREVVLTVKDPDMVKMKVIITKREMLITSTKVAILTIKKRFWLKIDEVLNDCRLLILCYNNIILKDV